MAILQDIWTRIKAVPKADWMVVGVIFLTASLAFGLGRLSVLYEGESDFKIEYAGTQEGAAITAIPAVTPESGGYVASKSGTKYHLPWCAGAQAIKESNKIYFATKEEAEKAGYAPAANCKGI